WSVTGFGHCYAETEPDGVLRANRPVDKQADRRLYFTAPEPHQRTTWQTITVLHSAWSKRKVWSVRSKPQTRWSKQHACSWSGRRRSGADMSPCSSVETSAP